MAKSTKVAPPRQRRQSSGEPPVAYTLEFIGGFESLTATGGEVGAAVRSPSLDAGLHPGGVVVVTFASRRPASGGAESGFALDGFQIDSLVDYLRGQADVRRALEAELQSDWKQVAAGKRAKGGGIWQHAEVRAVVLYRRHVPDPALLANMERLHGKRAVKDTIASADKPDTRSTFLVYVRLARQDYLAVFRDRALASFENL